jgi:FkbM family methyltransferase
MTEFAPVEDVEWRIVDYLWDDGEPPDYKLILPRPLADWDVWQYWERQRVQSMRQHLEPGMTLFDVGTEQGWCNLVYASMVGPANMVLIEPTPEFWPNIRRTWELNCGERPQACYDGLFSNTTTDTRTDFGGWPEASDGPLIDRNKYQYIHEHSDGIREIRLDDFVTRTGITPDAITMDVEGAEVLVLEGAEQTLAQHHPVLWISVHPDMAFTNHGVKPRRIFDYLERFGYQATHLATDHEEHFLFQ